MTPDYESLGRLFVDLLHIAQNRHDGVLLLASDAVEPIMLDNATAVYMFMPTADPALAWAALQSAPAYNVSHPAFPTEEGYEAFRMARKHAYAARTLALALVNNVTGGPADVPVVVD